jgi:hypothetical protein
VTFLAPAVCIVLAFLAGARWGISRARIQLGLTHRDFAGGHCPACRALFNPDGHFIGSAPCRTCNAPQQLPARWMEPAPVLAYHQFIPDLHDETECEGCGHGEDHPSHLQ